ncbi:MAG: twin-arginine translocation signal domain-containing protein [Clostridia bacterium]|nr:twin-arginine translocation signal domain-containing protein [Clostridia bacterium]
MSRRGFLKFLALTGTGLAQPKPNSSMKRTPNGSRCFSGLRVSLPRFSAVGSPSFFAM